MDVTKMIELLPNSVKECIIDFHDVAINTGKKRGIATRVVLERILKDDELTELSKHKRIVCDKDFIAHYRYAPEIKKSYFYVWH